METADKRFSWAMVALMGSGCCIFCVFVLSKCNAVALLQRALRTNWGSLPVTSDDAQPSFHSLYKLGQNLWRRRLDQCPGFSSHPRIDLWNQRLHINETHTAFVTCSRAAGCSGRAPLLLLHLKSTCSRKNIIFPHLPYDCSLKSQIPRNLWTLFHFCTTVKACGASGNCLWAGMWAAVVSAPRTRFFFAAL